MGKIGGLYIDIAMNVASIEKSTREVNSRLESFAKNIQKTFKFVAGAAIVGGVVKSLDALMDSIVSLAKEGAELSDLSAAFERLGGSSQALDQMSASFQGVLSKVEILKASLPALAAGIPGLSEASAQVAEFAARLSEATGQDSAATLEKVFSALASGSEKGLKGLGFTGAGETALERTANAIKELPEATSRLAPSINDVAKASEAVGVAWKDARGTIGATLNEMPQLVALFSSLRDLVNDVNWGQFGADLEPAFKVLTAMVRQATSDLDNLRAAFAGATSDALASQLVDVQARLSEMRGWGVIPNGRPAAEYESLLAKEAELLKKISDVKAGAKAISDQHAETKAYQEQVAALAQKRIALESTEKAAKVAAEKTKELERAFESFKKEGQDLGLKDLESQFSSLIDDGTIESLEKAKTLLEEIKATIAQGKTAEYSGLVSAGMITQEEATQRGQDFADSATAGLEKAATDAGKKLGDELGQQILEFANSISSALDLFIGLFNAIANASSIDAATGSLAGTGGAIGSTAGALGGAILGSAVPGIGTLLGAIIGEQLGSTLGSFLGGLFNDEEHPQTKAIKEVFKGIQELIDQIKGLKFYNPQTGEYQTFESFDPGNRGVFNTPGWATEFTASLGEAQGAVLGLGEAIAQMSGQADAAGEQIAYVLNEAIMGNLDNARLLVLELGYSFEQLHEALLKSAMQGRITWAEYNRDMAGIAQLYERGLAAVADLAGAMHELEESGGRGIQAAKGVIDIGVEAYEGGARTLDDLLKKLIEQGWTPERAQAFIQALQQQGITDVQALSQASMEQAGQIAGTLEALDSTMQEYWASALQTVEQLSTALNELPERVEMTVKVNAEIDPELQKILSAANVSTNGGTTQAGVSTGKMAAVGNKVASVRGLGGIGNQINIDARGATPGTESLIKRVMVDFENQLYKNLSNIVKDGRARNL